LLQDIKKWIFRRPEKEAFGKFLDKDLILNGIGKLKN